MKKPSAAKKLPAIPTNAAVTQYRPNGQSRRQARTTNEHDVFEGLPVRRWERQWVHVGKLAPPPPPEPELPLPRETHLLTPMAQALLHAARAGTQGRLQKIAAPAAGQRLFQTKHWIQVPKDQEAPEPVYLAKPPGVIKRCAPEMEPVPPPPPPPVVRPIRRAPPPKRRGKGRGRKPGIVRKTVTFAEESTHPVFVGDSTPASFQVPTPATVPSRAPTSPVLVAVQPASQVEEVTTGPINTQKILKEVSAGLQGEGAAVKRELPAGGDVSGGKRKSVEGKKSVGRKKKTLVGGKKEQVSEEASLKKKKGKTVSMKKVASVKKTASGKKKAVFGKQVASGEAAPEEKELGSGKKKKVGIEGKKLGSGEEKLDSGEKTLVVRERKSATGEKKKFTATKKDALGKVALGKAKKVASKATSNTGSSEKAVPEDKSLSKTNSSMRKVKKAGSVKRAGSAKQAKSIGPSGVTSREVSSKKVISGPGSETAGIGGVGLEKEGVGLKKVRSRKAGAPKKGKGIGSKKKGKKVIPMKGISQKRIRKSLHTAKSKVDARMVAASRATDGDIVMTGATPGSLPSSSLLN